MGSSQDIAAARRLQAIVAPQILAGNPAKPVCYPDERSVISLELFPSQLATPETVEWALNTMAADLAKRPFIARRQKPILVVSAG